MATTAISPGRRSFVVVWAALCSVAALSAAVLFSMIAGTSEPAETPMQDMDASMDSTPMPPIGVWPFLAMWVLMMTAMMLPSVAPVAVSYLRAVGARGRTLAQAGHVVGLVGGYLLVWAAVGLPAFGADRAFAALAEPSAQTLVWLQVGVLVVAGGYQFSSLKDRCLSHCRSPLSVLLHLGGFRGRGRDVRAGAWHGGYCVGCCWSLMLVLVAVGVMNVIWMAVLAAVVFTEKNWFHGRRFSRIVGGGLLVFAVLLPFQPALAGM